MTRILNNVRGIAGTMFELGDLKKNQQLNEAAYILEAYLNVLRLLMLSCAPALL